jgi:Flp pilus assembly pilin Flp
LLDVVGNGDKVAPEHIGATAVNVGVTFGLTVIVMVAVVAHCPALGVKVYVVVALLFSAGAQLPVIPLLEVVGNGDKVAPEHIGATDVNVGVMFGFTVIVIVAVVAHCPAVGVNV